MQNAYEYPRPEVIRGNVVDIFARQIYPAVITLRDGRIANIERSTEKLDTYLLPGFVDAHVHIESSLLIPSEFARLATPHGTVATVSDPHEIGNVLGVAGVEYMIANAASSPLKFNFGAPSCVPATTFETAGAAIGAAEVTRLLARPEVRYLSEMMNFPGVLHNDPEVLAKIAAAQAAGKPVDGHAPGLRGEEARRYIAAGISTDHESFTREEALDKLEAGCACLIREGSAARNFDALVDLLNEHSEHCMFCTDDLHPDILIKSHINQHVTRAIGHGIDLFKVLRAACINPVLHYNLDVGLLREGDRADFIEVANLTNFPVLRTIIDGQVVAAGGRALIPSVVAEQPNQFHAEPRSAADFRLPVGKGPANIIEAIDGQLVTHSWLADPKIEAGAIVSDTQRDILKIVVVNRYTAHATPAIALIKNIGLKRGAIASSVAHDSHNIVAVGTNDDDLCRAVNLIIENHGGLAAACGTEQTVLPLPVAGLMTTDDAYATAVQYTALDALAKQWGSPLRAPFMTLSFMALLVIPELKLSDLGLFDGKKFAFTPLQP